MQETAARQSLCSARPLYGRYGHRLADLLPAMTRAAAERNRERDERATGAAGGSGSGLGENPAAEGNAVGGGDPGADPPPPPAENDAVVQTLLMRISAMEENYALTTSAIRNLTTQVGLLCKVLDGWPLFSWGSAHVAFDRRLPSSKRLRRGTLGRT